MRLIITMLIAGAVSTAIVGGLGILFVVAFRCGYKRALADITREWNKMEG